MKISQKIGLLIGLCIGFAIALWLLQGLVIEREGFFRQVVTVNSHQNIIDDYRLVLRSVKYGMLFIVLTFAVFFLFASTSISRPRLLFFGHLLSVDFIAYCFFGFVLTKVQKKISQCNLPVVNSSFCCFNIVLCTKNTKQ